MSSLCDLPPQLGKDTRRQRKRLSVLKQLIGVALRDAHSARDKWYYTVSREATRCVNVLRRIKSLPLKPRDISDPDAFRPLEFLAKNGNPRISSEARSVLRHWRNIVSGNQRDLVSGSSCPPRETCKHKETTSSEITPRNKTSTRRTDSPRNNEDSAGSCFCRESAVQNKTSPLEDNKKKILIQIKITNLSKPSKTVDENVESSANFCSTPEDRTQSNFLEVYETLKKAHEAVKGRNSLTAEDSRRCVVTLKGLFLFPQAVTRDLLRTTDAGLRMYSLKRHSDPNVQSKAETLFNHWLMLIYNSN